MFCRPLTIEMSEKKTCWIGMKNLKLSLQVKKKLSQNHKNRGFNRSGSDLFAKKLSKSITANVLELKMMFLGLNSRLKRHLLNKNF